MPDDPLSNAVKIAEQKAVLWFNLIKFIGWPGVILIVIGYASWNVSSAVWPYIVKIADSHVIVVTGLLEQQKIQDQAKVEGNRILEKITTNQTTITNNQTTITNNQLKIIDEIATSLAVQGKLLIEIHKSVVKVKEPQ